MTAVPRAGSRRDRRPGSTSI